MNLPIKIEDIEFIRRCSDIALGIPVSSHDAIKIGDEHIVSDVKLSPIVEEWPIEIQLDNVCFGCAVVVLLLFANYSVKLVHLVDDGDTVTSI